MKKLIALAGFLTAMIWPSFGSAQVTQICDTQPVPAGQVIIRRFTGTCPGVNGTGQNATLHVRPPVSPMSICSESPFPSGYVITDHLSTNDCWNLATMQHNQATWTIKTPVSPMSVCSNSPIPTGYVITQALNSSDCFNANGTSAFSSFTIKIPGAQETVCSFSPIPSGYTIIQLVSNSNCQGSNGGPLGQAYVIKRN